MDLHILIFAAPAGLLTCYRRMTDATLFLALYGVTAAYFSGVMVRGGITTYVGIGGWEGGGRGRVMDPSPAAAT